jgi:hypothetical protein
MVTVVTPLKRKVTKKERNAAGEGGRANLPRVIGYLFSNSDSRERALKSLLLGLSLGVLPTQYRR